MRKYDIKNKRNIGIIIGISIIIIIMFSLVIKLFLSSDKKEYTVHDGALVFDKDKSIIKVTEDSTIKKKWNNKYYLKFKDNNYELGNTAISYNEKTGEIILYGKYYEIGSGELEYKDMQVDHVKSVFANTDVSHTMTEEEMYSEKNLLPACRQCNFYKSYGNLESFREALTNTLMKNLQKTFQYRLAIKYGLIQESIEPVQFYFEKIGINIDASDCGQKEE